MQISKSFERLQLDLQLRVERELYLPPPPLGWSRTLRQSLGMSLHEMAHRLGVSPTRVRQLEQAEMKQSITLSQLHRLAKALNSQVHYVIVPEVNLVEMVRRQARRKAADLIAAQKPVPPGGGNEALIRDAMSEEFHALVHSLIDKRGLWREDDSH
jgi:predicted DNA-binding mobile mystery protein A